MPKDEQDNYKKYLEKLASDKNILESAIEKGLKKGLMQGRKEGMEKGMEKGREEGMQEGERKKTLEIAKSLKIKGLSNEDITQITGLPEENFN